MAPKRRPLLECWPEPRPLSAKLEADKFDSCLRSENTEKKLQAEIKAAEALGLTQTPVFFVNGARINDLEQLMAYVAGQVEK